MPEALPAMPAMPEKKSPPKPPERRLKIVTEEDVISEETVRKQEIEDLTADAVHQPTLTESAQEGMRMQKEAADTEKRTMGTAKALGREQRAIREAQAALAHEAVDELVAEQEAEEAAAKGFQGEEYKPAAKKPSFWERVKGFLKS